ncbi:hypothetical protein V4R08_05140 [Nitrobacter sp. NHB1]|uniref:hypothetical protein n=1 Tax=Nitrobacter sp. NHB1 TaxID=3119830 RepID=UPI002FFD89CC
MPINLLSPISATARSAPPGNAWRFLCWLFGDEITRRFCAGLAGLENGLTKQEREARTAELGAELLSLEHTEEALVTRALAERLEVHRRLGASPMALLGLTATPVPVLAAAE